MARWIGRLLLVAIFCFALFIQGEAILLLHFPSLLIVFGGTFALLYTKFGGLAFFPGRLEEEDREDYMRTGLNSAILLGHLGFLVNFIVHCATLAEPSAFGPVLSVAFTPVLLGLFLAGLIFYPMTKNYDIRSQLAKSLASTSVFFVLFLVTLIWKDKWVELL